MLKLFALKGFKTWKAKSWIVQSLSRSKQNVAVQDLGYQVLNKNGVRFRNCGCQVLTIILTCVHVLEDQVMKDIILGKGLMLKFFTPKSFKTWKAKSWTGQSLSRLGDMELQKKCNSSKLGIPNVEQKNAWDFETVAAKSWQSLSLAFMSWKTKSSKT